MALRRALLKNSNVSGESRQRFKKHRTRNTVSQTEPSLNVIIDYLVPTEIPADIGIFELSTLMSLEMGLNHIALTVWQKEAQLRSKDDTRMRTADLDTDSREARLLESQFHWFGVSLCNYVSLVGFLTSLNRGIVGREDLQNTHGRKRIVTACKAYMDRVPEIRDVLRWRNKSADHFAIANFRDEDKAVALDMAPLHPISLVARRYHVRQWDQGKSVPGARRYEFPQWSITEVYERLAPRYWPSFRWPEAEVGLPR
jgi:hypothetical protein